jgi:uncharacterized protein (DUF362 family)
MSIVSVIYGDERRKNIAQAVRLVLDPLLPKLTSAKTILLKPNLVHHNNQLASTHIDAVRGVLNVIREHTQAEVLIGDASYHGTKAAFRAFGYENLLNEYSSVQLVDLNDDDTVPGFYLKRDGSRGEMQISRLAKQAGFTISLANMKTHRDTDVTLTTKNWTIGTWVVPPRIDVKGKIWPRWPYLHEQGSQAHHKTIAELLGQLKPDLAIIDAFTAMEGDGPTRGTPVEMHIALAGEDAVSVDAVATELMSIQPQSVDYLRLADERGYGTIKPSEVLGEKDWKRFKKSFIRPLCKMKNRE